MRRAVLLLMASLLLPLPALAQGENRAKELYDNGAQLYEEGRYEDAIAAWQEAYRLSEKPLLLFNIANALERIGRYTEALESLNRYRAFARPDERDTLERRIANLEKRVAEGPRTGIAVQELETKPIDGAATSSSDGPGAGPIALLVGGLAGAGAGGGLAAAALATRSQLAEQCVPHGDSNLCPASAEPLLKRDADLSLASDIGLIAGGAVAAAGLVLTIVDATTDAFAQGPGSQRPVFAVAPVPGGAVVLIGGRF